MKILLLVAARLASLACDARSETSAEALDAFQKCVTTAAKDTKLPDTVREGMRRFDSQFATGQPPAFSGEMLRGWMNSAGASFPAAVKKTALALADALDRESASRASETQTLTREILDGIMQAESEQALADLSDKARAAMQNPASGAY